MYKISFVLATALLALSCNNNGAGKSSAAGNSHDTTATPAVPDRKSFATTMGGKNTDLYVLRNKAGMTLAITNYGGRFVSLLVPDREGRLRDVVVGFKSVTDYVSSTEPYFGATIGRYGNRMAKGQFTLDGKKYQLSINNGPNTLHGGKNGFQ